MTINPGSDDRSTPPPITSGEAVEVLGHVSSLAASRKPLAAGLRSLSEEMPSPRGAAMLRVLAERLDDGASLEEALDGLGERFPEHLRGVMRTGIRSGRLAEVLAGYSQEQIVRRQMWREVWAAVAYPLLVLVVLAPIVLATLLVLVPAIGEVFNEFQLEIPRITAMLLWVANQAWWFLLAAGGIVAMLLLHRFARGRWLPAWLLAAMPLFGTLWRYAGLTEFASMLAYLVRERVRLPDALDWTADTLTDRSLAAATRELAAGVKEGQPLETCIAAARVFPPSLAPLIAWGGQAGDLAEALEIAQRNFEDRVRLQARLVRLILPPLAFMLIATAGLWLAAGLTMPLIRLITELS